MPTKPEEKAIAVVKIGSTFLVAIRKMRSVTRKRVEITQTLKEYIRNRFIKGILTEIKFQNLHDFFT